LNEPPTENKVTQINLGDEANLKPIFISKSLSPPEKEDLISNVREYIDVFGWNYEDIPGLDPQVAIIASTSIRMRSPSSNSNDDPPGDNGSDPVGSQEAYRLRFYQGRITP